MHLELVELLRCPTAHRDSVLVAATGVVHGRFIIQGTLGCPECGAEFKIVNGTANFAPESLPRTNASSDARHDASAAMRLAAQLGLSEGRSAYALVGYSVPFAIALREIVPARILTVNPPNVRHAETIFRQSSSPAGVVVFDERLPLASSKLDGIAFADSMDDALMIEAVESLRVGGRLVAPIHEPVPAGMRELVRDDAVWVAERQVTVSQPVELRRR
ncbi:MAG: hypothetical protein ABJB66_04090 [Gemmatimonadaceae bacterium]